AAQKDDLQDRHSAYYLDLMARQFDDLRGGQQARAFRIIEGEEANFFAAWDWGIARKHLDALTNAFQSLLTYNMLIFRPALSEQLLDDLVKLLQGVPHVDEQGKVYGVALAFRAGLKLMISSTSPQEARLDFQEAVAVLKSLEARRELAIVAMVGLF